LPRHLRSRAHVRDVAARVLDDGLRDLTCLPGPDLDGPCACALVESGVGRRMGRIAVEPAGDLVVLERELDGLGLSESGEVRRVRLGCADGGREEDGGRQPGRAAEDQLRGPNDQSLLPTKFTGVTRTIAIAWATTSPSPTLTSR
jgi:hypothetical protein